MDYIRVYRKAAYYRESFGDAVFGLSTWSLLCDGRLLIDVVILFPVSREPAGAQC